MRISDWSSDVCSSDLLLRPGGEVRMVVGVVADLVPVRDDPLQQPRMLQRVFADDEESGGRARALQHLQYLRRPFRIRPVVEGQGQHPAVLPACALHLIRRWQRSEERRVGKGWVNTGRSRW